MIYERITRDGRRELRIDDEIFEVPHDHEIAPDALFPEACRQAYWASPEFASVSRRDMDFMCGKMHLAAALDLLAMKQRLTPEVSSAIDQAVEILVETAIQSTSPAGIEAMTDQLVEAATVRVEAAVGPEADDEFWYRGAVKTCECAWVRPRAATPEERARASGVSTLS